MTRSRLTRYALPLALLLPTVLLTSLRAEETITPLFQTVDLNVGESAVVQLSDGTTARVKVVDLNERRDTLRGSVRDARVKLEVNGKPVTLTAAMYHLPVAVGGVQVDCPVTGGYTVKSSKNNVWALEKDVRLRLWPAGSPWLRPNTFSNPVGLRWFSSDTQMANDPCYVNACEIPGLTATYYHYGLDFGGAEGMVKVLAATDGLVVSAA